MNRVAPSLLLLLLDGFVVRSTLDLAGMPPPRNNARRTSTPLDVVLGKYGVDLVDPRLANVDETTARDLAELRARKLAAVGAEDYEYASQLKRADEQLQQLGAEVLRLDNERIAAVACEDYDDAKALRSRITWLQREAARRKALAVAAQGDPTPVTLEPAAECHDADADLLLAGSIAPEDTALASPLTAAFGIRLAAAALSSHWRARSAALERIARALGGGLVALPSAELAEALATPIARALSEAPVLPHAIAAATSALCALVEASAADAVNLLVRGPLPLLSALVTCAADPDAPSREMVVAACATLVEHPLLDAARAVPAVLALCAQPPSTQRWRGLALGLQMLRTLLSRCPHAEQAAGLPSDALVRAIVRGLHHPHAEVRAAAIEAAAALHVVAPREAARIRDGAPPSLAPALASASELASAAAAQPAAGLFGDYSPSHLASLLSPEFPPQAGFGEPEAEAEAGAAEARAAAAIQSQIRGRNVRRSADAAAAAAEAQLARGAAEQASSSAQSLLQPEAEAAEVEPVPPVSISDGGATRESLGDADELAALYNIAVPAGDASGL